jgi:hypothetical protein
MGKDQMSERLKVKDSAEESSEKMREKEPSLCRPQFLYVDSGLPFSSTASPEDRLEEV